MLHTEADHRKVSRIPCRENGPGAVSRGGYQTVCLGERRARSGEVAPPFSSQPTFSPPYRHDFQAIKELLRRPEFLFAQASRDFYQVDGRGEECIPLLEMRLNAVDSRPPTEVVD